MIQRAKTPCSCQLFFANGKEKHRGKVWENTIDPKCLEYNIYFCGCIMAVEITKKALNILGMLGLLRENYNK